MIGTQSCSRIDNGIVEIPVVLPVLNFTCCIDDCMVVTKRIRFEYQIDLWTVSDNDRVIEICNAFPVGNANGKREVPRMGTFVNIF